ncbi:MAG: hypothetical protein Fur0024_3290 [Patescibacteria group bacterium]
MEGIYVYSDYNFSGNCNFFTTSQPDARTWSPTPPNVGNDKLSSIKIVGSWKIYMCKDINYNNNNLASCFAVDSANDNEYVTKIDLLNKKINNVYKQYLQDFNDNVSSILIEKKGNCENKYNVIGQNSNGSNIYGRIEGGVYFYENDNYTGRCMLLPMRSQNGEDFAVANDLRNWYIGNDTIKSYYIIEDYAFNLWSDIELIGSTKYSPDNYNSSNLNGLTINGNASSIQAWKNNNIWTGGVKPWNARKISWKKASSVTSNSSFSDSVTNAMNDWSWVVSNNDANIKSLSFVKDDPNESMIEFRIENDTPSSDPMARAETFSFQSGGNEDNDKDKVWVDIQIVMYKSNMDQMSSEQKKFIIKHEIGHALSLAHPYDCPDSIMKEQKCYPFGSSYPTTPIKDFDKENLKDRWGMDFKLNY